MNAAVVLRFALAHALRRCEKCGVRLSTIGILLLAALVSACTAAGMSRLQASERTAVAVCGAWTAMREAGADADLLAASEKWCRAAMRRAAAETETMAAQLEVQLEAAVEESDASGLEVPAPIRDAGYVVPAGPTSGAASSGAGGTL